MSTNNSNQNAQGMIYPTTKAMVGSNPADSARLAAVNKGQAQAAANSAMAGGKLKRKNKKHRGGASTIAVPQYQMLYEPQGGTGTNPNNQIQGNAQTSTQMAANSVNDAKASKMGGGSKKRKGGNPDWVWGCMSGGKKRTRKHTRRNKNKKSRKSRTYRKY